MKKFYAFFASMFLAGGMMAQAETVELSFPHVNWADVVAAQGWWQLWGWNAGNDYYINVSPNYTDHLDGDYTVAEMYYAKMYHVDELAEDGLATIQFTSGNISLATNPYEVVMTVDCDADDANHYVADVHGFPHYNYFLTGDGALGEWDAKTAAYMQHDSIFRVLDPGVYDFKVLIEEGSFNNAIDGSRLNTEASDPCAEGGEVTDPITITLVDRNVVCFSVYENKVAVSVYSDYPAALDYDGNTTAMFFNNDWNGFVADATWTGEAADVDASYYGFERQTVAPEEIVTWCWSEDEQAWVSAVAPEVGTACLFIYDPILARLEALYEPQTVSIEALQQKFDTVAAKSFMDNRLTITSNGRTYNAAGIRVK